MRIILPDSGAELLRRELVFAFSELGHEVRRVHPAKLLDESSSDYLPALLESGPDLFFSVNLQGLLPGGRVPQLLRQAGVPVLAWFVDNPWHILSGMRDPSWRHFYLAITDHTFIEPLSNALTGLRRLDPTQDEPSQRVTRSTRNATVTGELEKLDSESTRGHRKKMTEQAEVKGVAGSSSQPPATPGVFHMPLAACPSCLEQSRTYSSARDNIYGGLGQIVFAGRSAFPDRDGFFAGQKLPAAFLGEAEALCRAGTRPDFAWWLEKLDLSDSPQALWPGKKSRAPGLGAAESNRIWREQRLGAVMGRGLTVFGDRDWGFLGAGLDLRPPFDYYARAHGIYAQAAFSLNLNSLLMNAGLTQRIFDVWPTGGFCLTDNSPGLDIFPDELTQPVTFNKPEELPELVENFLSKPNFKDEMAQAWREHILQNHTYTVRLENLLQQTSRHA